MMYLATGPEVIQLFLPLIDITAVGPGLNRLAAHRGGVRTGLRLGQRERADLAAFSDGAHIQLLLGLSTEFEDTVAEQRVIDRHDRRVSAIGLGDFDHRQHIADRVHAGAAVFGRYLDAHQAVLAEGTDVVERKFAGLVVMLCAGRDLLLRDAAGHVLNHQLFFCEAKIHGRVLGYEIETNIVTVGLAQPQHA